MIWVLNWLLVAIAYCQMFLFHIDWTWTFYFNSQTKPTSFDVLWGMIFLIASFITSLVIHWVIILSFLKMAGIRWLAKVDPSSPLDPKSTADKSPRWSSKPRFRDTTTKGWAIISEAAEVMTSAGLFLRQANMSETVDVDVEEAAESVPQPTRFASLTDRLRASAGVVWDQVCSSPADWCQTCKSIHYFIVGKFK